MEDWFVRKLSNVRWRNFYNHIDGREALFGKHTGTKSQHVNYLAVLNLRDKNSLYEIDRNVHRIERWDY